MTEDIFKNHVSRIEKIYSELIKGESNPQKEVEKRIELIDALSNIEASLISEKEHNQDFITLLINLRESLLNWDPYGQWFRQQKSLMNSVYEVIINAKNVVFIKDNHYNSEATRLKSELDALKSELSDLRALMSSLIKEKDKSRDVTIPDSTVPPIDQSIDLNDTSTRESLSAMSLKQEESDILEQITSTQEDTIEESEPPIMTPIITPKKTIEADKIIAQEETLEEEEERTIVSEFTLKKIDQSSKDKSSNVLSKMKSIITEAEIETEKQISDFKEQFKSTTITPPIVQDEPDRSSFSIDHDKTPTTIKDENEQIESIELDSPDSQDKPSEIIKPKEIYESLTPADPYMQLLTLEAEKYRLEKEIERNETEFQEGLKSKQEFDKKIELLNKELSFVRQQIDDLRKQLTS